MTMNTKEEIQVNTKPVVDCSTPDCVVVQQCCGVSENVTFGKCEDWLDYTVLGDRTENKGIELSCQARFLKIRLCLKNICVGRKIAVGVMICDAANFQVLGFKGKVITVPGQPGSCCNSLNVSDFCFVIPENNICTERRIKVNVIAHYTDLNPNPGGCPV